MKIADIWFDPPRVRWGRVLGTAAILFVPLLGWMAYERGVWTGDETTVIAGGAKAIRTADTRVERVGTAGSLRSVAPALPGSSAPARPTADEIEVCGVGTFKVGADRADAAVITERILNDHSPAARSAWLKAMQSSPSMRTRAAGFYLEALQPTRLVEADMVHEELQRDAECGGAKACIEQLERQRAQQRDAKGSTPRDQLARLAQESSDPMVYAYAMNLCDRVQLPSRSGGAPGACQLLSYEQWATVDPDNAQPWLVRAERVSGVEQAEAIERAAQSKAIKSYWGSLPPLVMAVQPATVPAVERILMSMDSMAADGAFPIAASAVTRYCTLPLLGDANRRQTCNVLAELFVTRSDTLVTRGVGESLGERLGWPAERLAKLQEESDALRQALEERGAAPSLSCHDLEANQAHFAEVSRLGEIGAARAALRRSGKSVAELAQVQRGARQAIQAAIVKEPARPTSSPAF
jgi:hypothetical protein